MKQLSLFFVAMAMLVAPLMAQETYNCKVTLLEQTEEMALFSVQLEVEKKGDLEKNACEALLAKLVLEGVEGFYNGRPVSNKDAKYWRGNALFNSENNYTNKRYVEYQLEKEPVLTSSGKTKGVFYFKLNLRNFLGYLNNSGALAK